MEVLLGLNSGYGWDTAISEGVKGSKIGGSFFRNQFVFCIELGQQIQFGDGSNLPWYSISEKISLDGSESDTINGLAYILNQESSRSISESQSWALYQKDPIQLALWAYLKTNATRLNSDLDLKGDFMFPSQGTVWVTEDPDKNGNYDDSYITVENSDETPYGGNTNAGKNAYRIYANALNTNSSHKIYKADIYILATERVWYKGGVAQSEMQRLMLVDSNDIEEDPSVQLTLYKKNFNEAQGLSNAIIKIWDTDGRDTKIENLKKHTVGKETFWGLKSASDGLFGTIEIKPKENNGTVKIKVKEMQAPASCEGLDEEIELTITYDTKTGEVKGIVTSEYSKFFSFETGDTGVIKIKNLAKPDYKIKKIDENENALKGVEFEVSYDLWDELDIEKEYENETFTTNANGEVNILSEKIKQAIMNKFISEGGENPITFWISIKEVKTKDGYINIFGTKSVSLIYDGVKLYNAAEYDYSDIADGSYKINEGESCIYIKNKSGIEKLTILKVDSTNPNKKLEGAKFEITLNNISKVNGKEYSEPIIKTVSENGQIVLEKLEIADLSKDITIQIKETEAPKGYKLINGTITIKLKRDGDKYTTHTVTTEGNVLQSEVKAGDISVNNHEVQLTIGNLEVIKLSGQVWLDGQIGNKDVSESYNGKIDSSEQKVQGVKVYLYDANGNLVTQDGLTNPVTTAENGTYEFDGILKTAEGYQIFFEYNGILYDDVGILNDSDAADEPNKRAEVNNRFKTIEKDVAKGASGEITSLEYNYADPSGDKLGYSTLVATNDGYTPLNSAVIAKTNGTYKTTTTNIDCGLISKYYDLKLDNLVENITYTINGKNSNGAPEVIKTDEANRLTIYNTSIYNSDYYYRYNDYDLVDTVRINNNGSLEEVNDALDAVNDGEVKRSDILTEGTELKAYVKYNLLIGNQSSYPTETVVIKYTYNSDIYKLVSAEGAKETGKGEFEITVNKLSDTKTIPIEFEVIDQNTNRLPTAIESGLEAITTAEIISYTTDGGLIDVDSEPGNGENYKEDDFSQAKVNFELKETVREISGNVAEDTDTVKNGTLDSEGINNVIVQLIEIVKDNHGKSYEYIWQETVSGSNIVKARSTSNNVYTYNNNLTGSIEGKYQFLGYSATAKDSTGNNVSLRTGFIPGNYVIRFIYGDGTTLYSGRTELLSENVAKYNGQDYKSTIDNSYKQEWYSNANYDGKSTARDNEARRLEVMAFSTEIDGKLGVALKTLNEDLNQFTEKEKELLKEYYDSLDKNTLEVKFAYRASQGNPYDTTISIPEDPSPEVMYKLVKYYVSYKTWMSAETSKIDVGVDSTTFDAVNFGLAKRPETKLTIEKHITGLKITPTGTGVQPIVDATKGIDEEKPKGVTNGLATIASTRGNRGFWKVETDIEELMQGATLEAEYTYVIKNESDTDYLGTYLISQFGTDNYKQVLMNKKSEVKSNTKGKTNLYGSYLGEYYYNGNDQADGIDEVPSIVETLEEALNNQLAFKSSSDFTAETLTDTNNYNYYNQEGTKDLITIKTLVKTNSDSGKLNKGDINPNKKLRLETTLSSSNNGEIGANIPSYIAEITKYSNAAGRENIAVPENLSYVHSEANELTLDSYVAKDAVENIADIKATEESGYVQINEADEFWGETIIISKPTGQDKNTAMLITIIAISGVAVIGVGIILIKKIVIKK